MEPERKNAYNVAHLVYEDAGVDTQSQTTYQHIKTAIDSVKVGQRIALPTSHESREAQSLFD